MVYLAWMVALIATLAALFIGEVMGQARLAICAGISGRSCFRWSWCSASAPYRGDTHGWHYRLPLAVAGVLVSAYHVLLYTGLIPAPIVACAASGPSCSDAQMIILGGVPIPLLSLLSFTLIAALLLASRRRNHL